MKVQDLSIWKSKSFQLVYQYFKTPVSLVAFTALLKGVFTSKNRFKTSNPLGSSLNIKENLINELRYLIMITMRLPSNILISKTF